MGGWDEGGQRRLAEMHDFGNCYLGGDRGIRKGFRTMGSETYIKESIKRLETKYQKKVKFASTPLPAKDNPESDTSDYCDEGKKKEYQSLTGMCIWAVTLGRIDICYATSSLGRFNSEPRIGQLERLWRLIGYLKKNPEKFIVIDSREPSTQHRERHE